MATFLDHTIVPVRDRDEAAEFYSRIFGFENLGERGPNLAVRVNDSTHLYFRNSDDFRSIHYAFAMEPGEFEAVFTNIRDSGIPYRGNPSEQDSLNGQPGMTFGAKGMGKAVYFEDPNGHVLEIKTY